MPATSLVLRPLILEVLKEYGAPLERNALSSKVQAKLNSLGFFIDPQRDKSFRDALSDLKREGQVSNPRMGWWSLAAGASDESSQPATNSDSTNGSGSSRDDLIEDVDDEDEKDEEQDQSATNKAQRVIGAGPECVYVYYHDVYEELARSRGRATWECKIGSTLGESNERVKGQGALTCFPRPPIIALEIRTGDCRHLERILHAALTFARKRLASGGGSEWFMTSPEQVERWYNAFLETIKLFDDEGSTPHSDSA